MFYSKINEKNILVRFRFTADFKCLKLLLGLKGGSANCPCYLCLQKHEPTFREFTDAPGQIRDKYNMEVSMETGQGHKGILSWVKPYQLVAPTLHLPMGIAEVLFDFLLTRIINKKIKEDFDSEVFKNIRNANKKVTEAREKLEAERDILNDWKDINNFCQTAIFSSHEFRYPEGIDVTNAEKEWDTDICGSKNCISELADKILPNLHSTSEEVPSWIWSKPQRKWYHTLCLSLSSAEAIRASKSKSFNPSLPNSEAIKREISIQVEWGKKRVEEAETKLEEAILKLNLPKLVTDLPAIKAFFKVFESFGAYQSAYFQRFNGNQIHSILKAAIQTDGNKPSLESKLRQEEELKEMFDEEDSKRNFSIEDFDPSVVQKAMDFCHYDNHNVHFDDDANELFRFAQRYEIDGLKVWI